MRLRLFVSFLIISFTLNSEAQLRCFSFFTSANLESPQYYAEVIDQLNSKYNNFLFEKSLADSRLPELISKSFSERTQARYQAFKLNRILKSLKSSSSWDKYDFENFAKKLERLTFLTDTSVTIGMNRQDRVLYEQARHSLLAKGLENFLFVDTKASQSLKLKVFNWVMVPFKDFYNRWTYAMVFMPKLNGALLPDDLAAQIAWQGLDRNREFVAAYLLHSEFKNFFNVFSATYNWTLVAAIFVALPAYSYLTFTEIQETGNAKVQALFDPLLQQSKEMAQVDYHQRSNELTLKFFTEEFLVTYNRLPNEIELSIFKKAKGL